MAMFGPDSQTIGDYARFAADSAAEAPAYVRLMRGRGEVLEINAAERFARDWLARRRRRLGPQVEGEIVEGALADGALNGLGLVAAAYVALQAKRFAEAQVLAERAYATDQHETFAQRLFLAAAEESTTLRLAVDDWLEDRFCPNPFTDVEVIGSGDVYTCCAAWLPAAIGSARDPERRDYWQGERARELRRSVLDGDFGHCSRLSCPKIAGRTLPRRDEVREPALRAAIESHGAAPVPPPARVLLSYDTSCNLSCPSCRDRLLSLGQAEARGLDAFYDDRIAPLLKHARAIKVTGSGDPFGSRHFRHVLAKLTATPAPEPRLQLHTNGVLMDRRAWAGLRLAGHVRSVWVSVDAAEAETYAVLRRGGSFTRLLANLAFLGEMRAAGQIGEFRLDFVVQAENFRQMPAFVALARRVGADGVHFLMLRNWGTFSAEEYRAKAVCFEHHPQFRALMAVLRDPALDAPGVDLGNLAPLRQRALEEAPRAPEAHPLSPAVVFLAAPRTGSNYLMECMHGLKGLLVLQEVFNPEGAFGFGAQGALLDAFAGLIGAPLINERDPRLIAHIARDPEAALAEIRAVAAAEGFAAVALKVFPGHLPDEVLKEKVLEDPGLAKIFIARPLLETYISYRKAQLTEGWWRRDSTEIRPELEIGAYEVWLAQTRAWYEGAQRAVLDAGQRFGWLSYADFAASNPVRVLDGMAAMLHDLGLPLARGQVPAPKSFRQDTTADVFARIANGPAFRAALQQRGLLEISLAPPERLRAPGAAPR